MSVIKQTLYIARKNKKELLEKALFILKQEALKQGAVHFEVFQCDEDINELLLYQEWKSQEASDRFAIDSAFKVFEKNKDSFVYKSEVLNLM